jgi:hypothetical protein
MRRVMIGISRFEYGRSCGWLARYETESGRLFQKLFSDSRYQWCEKSSHKAAKEWLAEQAHTHAPKTRIKSGRGICFRLKKEKSGHRTPVFDVSYTEDGRRKTKSFRIGHYPSQQAAYNDALTFRYHMEHRMRHERWRLRQTLYDGQRRA